MSPVFLRVLRELRGEVSSGFFVLIPQIRLANPFLSAANWPPEMPSSGAPAQPLQAGYLVYLNTKDTAKGVKNPPKNINSRQFSAKKLKKNAKNGRKHLAQINILRFLVNWVSLLGLCRGGFSG